MSAPRARQVLDNQAQWLSRYPRVAVRIEGNCDERGTREFNLALGARRAEFVKNYLTQHGVDAGRNHHHLLRQGAAHRHRQRRGRLRQEPQRPHTAITAGAVGGVSDPGQ